MTKTGGDKGKGIDTSSSQAPARKRRNIIQEESEDEDMGQEESTQGTRLVEDPVTHHIHMCPEWTEGILSNFDPRWQPRLFKKKMAKNTNRKDGFLFEKEVPNVGFSEFGIVKMFQALGWEAALKCYEQDKTKLYMDPIEEWVSTLKKVGEQGPGMKLIGTVNGVEIVLSFQTMREIAKFDSKPSKGYKYPSLNDLYFEPEQHPTWNSMLERIFVPNRNMTKLLRVDLKIEAKVLLLIIHHNVIPRRGDKEIVRYPEVPILYALLTGRPLVSYRYIVMNNIWLSRDSVSRRFIPHCGLITALIQRYGMISDETPSIYKRQSAFDFKKLGPNWEFKESARYLKLKNQNQRWKVLKRGARELRAGEADEEDSGEQEETSGDEMYMETQVGGSRQQGEMGGTSRSRRTRDDTLPYEYASGQFDQNWAHTGSLQEVIKNARPEAYYHWTESAQVGYDHTTHMGASHERTLKRMEDRQETWNRAHAYAFQQEINYRYEDDRQRRMHEQWHAGQEVVPDPPMVDYTTLPPFDGSITYPMPPLHHSQWVDPRQGQSSQPPQQQQQQDDRFGFEEFSETFTQIFGPPGPRYY